MVTVDQFLQFVDPFLPRFWSCLGSQGRIFCEVGKAKKSSAGCLDGWAWNEIK